MKSHQFRGVITALSSISHNGGESFGINTKFRRERFVQPDGSIEDVPVISGNSLRGLLRDIGMLHMCRKLGYGVDEEKGEVKGLTLQAFYFLFSGGTLTSVSGGGLDIDKARQLRELIPLVGIFGGAMGNQIMPGKIKVGKAIPICAETKHLLPNEYAGDDTNSIWDFLQEEMYTRKDDEKDEHLRRLVQPHMLALKAGKKLKPELALTDEETHSLPDAGPQQMMYYCVTGDTPIYLSDGKIIKAVDLFDSNERKVLSYDFNSKNFKSARIQDVKSWIVDKTIKIKTTFGYEITGTLDHKMLSYGKNGLIWKKLKDITIGDQLAISDNLKTDRIYDDSLNSIDIFDNQCAFITNDFLDILQSNFSEQIHRSKDLKRAYPGEVRRNNVHKYAVKISVIKKAIYEKIITIDYCKSHIVGIVPSSRSNKFIKPQWMLNEKHFKLLGYYLSDGSIDKKCQRFHFANKSEDLRNEFISLMLDVFGIEPSTISDIGVGYSSPLICQFFIKVFNVSGGRKSRVVRIPNIVFISPNQMKEVFICAYKNGDGFSYNMNGRGREYGKRNVIVTSSFGMAVDFVYLLTQLGFVASLSKGKVRKQRYGYIAIHRVEWSNVSNHKRYLPKGIGDILTNYRIENGITKKNISELSGTCVETIQNIELGKHAPSTKIINEIERVLDIKMQPENLNWVSVKEIELNDQPTRIYAFDVQEYHNFVCGSGPFVSHNCETLSAGTKFYWEIILDDVTDIEFEAFLTTLSEFSRMPYIGGKSGVGLGKIAVNFDKWFTVDPHIVDSKAVSFEIGKLYENYLKSKKQEIKAVLNAIN